MENISILPGNIPISHLTNEYCRIQLKFSLCISCNAFMIINSLIHLTMSMFSKKVSISFSKVTSNKKYPFLYSQNIFIPIQSYLECSRR